LPIHLLVGNHDSSVNFLGEFAGDPMAGKCTEQLYYVVDDYDDARIFALCTLQDGELAGRLGTEQLEWLDGELSAQPDKPALVCLHHPPVPVGLPFMDNIRLLDGQEFGLVLARHRNVVRVTAGHLHRPITSAIGGVPLTLAPSTYRQLDLCMREGVLPAYAYEGGAFLLHTIARDGACVTHTVAVTHSAMPIAHF
jgi:3',5'-cyclic AMP phosphodiesterase CpdA